MRVPRVTREKEYGILEEYGLTREMSTERERE